MSSPSELHDIVEAAVADSAAGHSAPSAPLADTGSAEPSAPSTLIAVSAAISASSAPLLTADRAAVSASSAPLLIAGRAAVSALSAPLLIAGTAAVSAPSAPLLRLPLDVLLCVIDLVDARDYVQLSSTCRTLRRTLTTSGLLQRVVACPRSSGPRAWEERRSSNLNPLWEQLIIQTAFVDRARQRILQTPDYPGMNYAPSISDDGRYVAWLLQYPYRTPPIGLPSEQRSRFTWLCLWDLYADRCFKLDMELSCHYGFRISLHVQHDLLLARDLVQRATLWHLDAHLSRVLYSTSETLQGTVTYERRPMVALLQKATYLMVHEEQRVLLHRVEVLKERNSTSSAAAFTWTGVYAAACSNGSPNIVLAGAFDLGTLHGPASALDIPALSKLPPPEAACYHVPANTVQHWAANESGVPILLSSRLFPDFPALPGRLELSENGRRDVSLSRFEEHTQLAGKSTQYAAACTWDFSDSAQCAPIPTLGYACDYSSVLSPDGRFWAYSPEGQLPHSHEHTCATLIYDLDSPDTRTEPLSWDAGCDYDGTDIREAMALMFAELSAWPGLFADLHTRASSATYILPFWDFSGGQNDEDTQEQFAMVPESLRSLKVREIPPAWTSAATVKDSENLSLLSRHGWPCDLLQQQPSSLSPDKQWMAMPLREVSPVSNLIFPIRASEVLHRDLLRDANRCFDGEPGHRLRGWANE